LAGLTAPRGRPRRDPQHDQISRLQREKHQLEQELAKARFVVEVQAKLHGALGDHLRERGHRSEVNAVTDEAITTLTAGVGVRAACSAVGAAQAGYYRAPPEQSGTD